jgi:hypothetical protein
MIYRGGVLMATKLFLSGASGDEEIRRVSEDAGAVAARINAAKQNDHAFAVLTDADSGKEFSVEWTSVLRFEAE